MRTKRWPRSTHEKCSWGAIMRDGGRGGIALVPLAARWALAAHVRSALGARFEQTRGRGFSPAPAPEMGRPADAGLRFLAEGAGFEPAVGISPHTLSRRAT